MGNFSRDTFNKAKGYTSVRLQQGVPLVDADWNEQADILRHQTNDSLDFVAGTGVPASMDMVLSGAGLENDFDFELVGFGRRILVNGRLVTVPPIRYSTQPWTNPATAAAAGVPVIPPLTTPELDRIDCVYLDVWEREVNSLEDPDLVNSVIGVETAVRTRYEVAVRVGEGAQAPPPAPPGHIHVAMARMQRFSGAAWIGTFSRDDPAGLVRDIRPVLPSPVGGGRVIVPPFYTSIDGATGWNTRFLGGELVADKLSNVATASGSVILDFPHGARLTDLTAQGECPTVGMGFSLYAQSRSSGMNVIFARSVNGPNDGNSVGFNTTWPIGDLNIRIDNYNFIYLFTVGCEGNSYAQLRWVYFDYVF